MCWQRCEGSIVYMDFSSEVRGLNVCVCRWRKCSVSESKHCGGDVMCVMTENKADCADASLFSQTVFQSTPQM